MVTTHWQHSLHIVLNMSVSVVWAFTRCAIYFSSTNIGCQFNDKIIAFNFRLKTKIPLKRIHLIYIQLLFHVYFHNLVAIWLKGVELCEKFSFELIIDTCLSWNFVQPCTGSDLTWQFSLVWRAVTASRRPQTFTS